MWILFIFFIAFIYIEWYNNNIIQNWVRKYMGYHIMLLQLEADKNLGR